MFSAKPIVAFVMLLLNWTLYDFALNDDALKATINKFWWSLVPIKIKTNYPS